MVEFEFSGEFLGGSTDYVSLTIAKNVVAIARAKITVNTACLAPDPSNFTFTLSNDGGATWEAAENGVEHTFTSIGSDLRYKITAISGSVLSLKQSSGDSFITVKYG